MSTGRGWRTKHPNTSCPAGSECAGSAAGSERVRLAEPPAPRIGGGRWRTPLLGPFEGSPLGPEGYLSGGTEGNPLERGEGGGYALSRGTRLTTRCSQVGEQGRAGSGPSVFWEVAGSRVGLLRIGRANRVGLVSKYSSV